MWKEFKEFALKGDAIALAVGVVMGAAFNAIVQAIVKGLITPLVGVIVGGVNLQTASFSVMGVEFFWGLVVDAIIGFLAIAIVLFIVVKAIAKLAKEPDPTTHPCPYCTTEVANEATRCPACTSELTPQT